MKKLVIPIAMSLLQIGFLENVFAVEQPLAKESQFGALSPEDLLIKAKARKRTYPGGRDEESLRVQPQMVQPTRKMGPATEAPEPASASPADD